MLEPAFSEEFSKILKQMNRNIIYVNGLAHYQIPVHQIKLLEKLFYSNDRPSIIVFYYFCMSYKYIENKG